MEGKRKYSLGFTAFLQAAGLTTYCSLVALLLWQGNRWFGKVPGYFGPLLFLILFSTSALICALITLYQPFVLWQKKQTDQALKLIVYTTGWLFFFTVIILILLLSIR
jgi:hypothetical protein